MSIFKDWQQDTNGLVFRYRLKELIDPRVWLRLHKWRKQRANRGWSDRDAWGAGDHIAQMTAEMLQHLNDKGHVDWPHWFEYNIQEKGSYKNIQSIVNDINNYLEFMKTDSWAEGLESKTIKNADFLDISWLDKNGKKLSEKQISARIKKYTKKENDLYNKATNAMQFFSRNFGSFWD